MTENDRLRKQVKKYEDEGATPFVSSRENRTDTGMTLWDAVRIIVVIAIVIVALERML